MAIDLTERLDEATKLAQFGKPIEQQFSPAIPTLGSGITGLTVPPASTAPVTRNDSGVITAETAQATAGAGMQRPGGVFGSIDMKGVNEIMSRENVARQSMIDSQRTDNKPGGGVAIMSDGGIEAANAEKTARWRQDDLLEKAARGNQAAVGAAIQANAQAGVEGSRSATALRGQDLNFASDVIRNGITARGQDLSAQSDASRIGVTLRGQDISANTDAQRLGIDQSRLGIQQADSSRADAKWGIDKTILQGQAADSEMVRGARTELSAALASGDPAKVEAAKAKAVAAGVKFDKPNNEFTAVTDSMGMNVTRTNKDTGAVDIINPKTGDVKSIPAPGAQKAAIPVPPGHSVVGTSNGKRVLQDASGKRFIEGGN